MKRSLLFLTVLLTGFTLQCTGLPGVCQAAVSASSVKEKKTLQNQQLSNKDRLSSIQKEIQKKEGWRTKAVEELRSSEQAISQSQRSIKELGDKKAATEETLQELRAEKKIVSLGVQDADLFVSHISQAQFLNSRRHPWQKALEGGNPNDISRLSYMLQFMSREQTKTLNDLENRQKNIEAVARKETAKKQELIRISAEEQKTFSRLTQEKARRETALESLKSDIKSQKDRYEQLVKKDQELSQLITQIDRRIERELQKALAQKKAQEERRQRQLALARKNQTAAPAPKPAPRPAYTPVVGNFGSLKGRLLMPARGTVIARFGQKRDGATANLLWRGMLIEAKLGQPVVATAAGTVVFSDWMRGFGNLLILDHGSNYLSIYANNESLYKSVGDSVNQGDTIATVGNSGGEDASGLYFELRYKGKPFDPSRWIAR